MSAKRSFIEVPSKMYEIKSSNSLKDKLSTSNTTIDLSNPTEEQAIENDSIDYNQFDYERYLDSKRSNQMALQKQETNQQLVKMPEDQALLAIKLVKQKSAIQFINDLTHLLQNHEPNVFFHFGRVEVGLHSLVLLARSAWFRRSWRMSNDKKNSVFENEYSFNYKSNKKFKYDCEIKLESELPDLVNGRFDFEVILNNYEDENNFLKAFNEFKSFLYRGDCEINSEVANYLISLAEIFQVDFLKEYLSSYYQKNVKSSDVDKLIKTLELAHIYQIEDLKRFCIDQINKNSYVVVNAACWKGFSAKYPDLVLEIFRKKPTTL